MDEGRTSRRVGGDRGVAEEKEGREVCFSSHGTRTWSSFLSGTLLDEIWRIFDSSFADRDA
jgi:hypothetical protein